MKFTALLAAAAATLHCVSANPILDVAHTEVAIDKNRAALDAGELTISITRTDDLVSDDKHKLLLEKVSHIILKVQLDAANSAVRVNDQPFSLFGLDKPDEPTMIQVDGYHIPDGSKAALLSPEELDRLTTTFVPGIVGAEVGIHSETVKPFGDMAIDAQDNTISLRRVGVFLRLIEIAGNKMHESKLAIPILQLLISSADGKTVHKVETLSIGGEQPTASIAAVPQTPGILRTGGFGFGGYGAPLTAADKIAAAKEKLKHKVQLAEEKLENAVAKMEHKLAAAKEKLMGKKKGCHKALQKAGASVKFLNPFSDMEEELELSSADQDEQFPGLAKKPRLGHAFGKNNPHGVHKSRKVCRKRIAAFLVNFFTGFFLTAALFKFVRSVKKRRAARRAARDAEEAGSEATEPLLKEVVVYDDLPSYEEKETKQVTEKEETK